MIIFVTYDGRKVEYVTSSNVQRLMWIIEDLIAKNKYNWQLQNSPDMYALKTPGDSGEYLDEQNYMSFLRDGAQFIIKLAPAKEAHEAVLALRSTEDKKKTIFSLSRQFADKLFAISFVEKEGVTLLVDAIEKSTGNNQNYALQAMLSLMQNDVPWNTFGTSLIELLVNLLVNPNSLTICRYATAILTIIVSSGPANKGVVRNYGFNVVHPCMPDVAYTKLIERIADNDVETQINSFKLLNAMFQDAPGPNYNALVSKINQTARKAITRHMQSNKKEDVGQELVKFQRLFYKELQRRQRTPFKFSNPEHSRLWNEIIQQGDLKNGDLTVMGFKSNALESELGSVGILGVECIYTFVNDPQKPRDFFPKLILEQNSRTDGKRCPIGLASIEITKALMEHFQVVNDQYASQYPMVLCFEEIFIIALQGLLKFWSEMEASESDLGKVVALVKTQLDFTSKDPEVSVDQFKSSLLHTPVKEVQQRLLLALQAGDDLLSKAPVRTLRERVHKEVYEFVQDQRVNVLLAGSFFANYTLKGKVRGQYRFYKLSPNKKYLHYAEYTELFESKPTLDQLPEKLELSSVADVVEAFMSPMFPNKREVPNFSGLTFSLVGHDGSSIADIVADNATQYAEWTDGLRIALNKNPSKRETIDYIDNLTDIDVKIKILQLRVENISIPDEAPTVPPPPANYDFHFKLQ